MTEAFPSSIHQPLFKYIEAHSSTPLTDNEREMIKGAFTFRKFRKKQYLSEAGEICKALAFILKGARSEEHTS